MPLPLYSSPGADVARGLLLRLLAAAAQSTPGGGGGRRWQRRRVRSLCVSTDAMMKYKPSSPAFVIYLFLFILRILCCGAPLHCLFTRCVCIIISLSVLLALCLMINCCCDISSPNLFLPLFFANYMR